MRAKGNLSSNLTSATFFTLPRYAGVSHSSKKRCSKINCVLLPLNRALFGCSRAAEIYYNKPFDIWTSRSVTDILQTSWSRLPNAVKECGGGKCNHHVQIKIVSQRISKAYGRMRSTGCLAVGDGAPSVDTLPGEANGIISCSSGCPKLSAGRNLRSEFQEQQSDDYQCNHQHRFE